MWTGTPGEMESPADQRSKIPASLAPTLGLTKFNREK